MDADGNIYFEKVTSKRTAVVFVGLTSMFLLLLVWCVKANGWNGFAMVFLIFFCFFLFCSVNYRILNIRITSGLLKLAFGIFTWTVPVANIERCSLDEIPLLVEYGGAGIHFMFIGNRYRASFNFLEHPRVVIAFKRRVGPVRDLSFSTRRPMEILRIIQESIST